MKYQWDKNRKNGFAIGGLLLTLAIILIIGGGVYGAVKKYQPAPQEHPVSPAPISSPPIFSTSTKPIAPDPKQPPQDNGVSDNPEKKCIISGCSGEICADKQVNSICIYKPEFACYTSARCQLQSNGTCDWTQTPELKACIANARKETSVPPKQKVTLPDLDLTCTTEYRPVCGIDGKVYGNDCTAKVAGIEVKHTGECSTPRASVSAPQSFTIEADDRGFYPPNTITVPRETNVTLTLKVRMTDVYYGGLTFRSAKFNDLTLKPGASGSVQFIADENITIASFWPLSGVHKADLRVVVQ